MLTQEEYDDARVRLNTAACSRRRGTGQALIDEASRLPHAYKWPMSQDDRVYNDFCVRLALQVLLDQQRALGLACRDRDLDRSYFGSRVSSF